MQQVDLSIGDRQTKIVVIGAGISGAHAALTLLERNFQVELWDVGRDESDFPSKTSSFHGLKTELENPIDYFLGKDLSAIVPPESDELLSYPPSRNFLLSNQDPLWNFTSEEFFPFASFNIGGLANGWGANALSFDENDISDWPISYSEMESAYKTVSKRIPIAGPTHDDLSQHLKGTYPTQRSVKLTKSDENILNRYTLNKKKFNQQGIYLGRSRLAVITDSSKETGCNYCERCLWGCPNGSIYNPKLSTLKQCEDYKDFKYIPNRMVIDLISENNKIIGIRYLDTQTDRIVKESCTTVFLAAGALQSGSIFLRTMAEALPQIRPESAGLMDTTVIKIPFVSLQSIGSRPEEKSFQFNRLLMGIVSESNDWPKYLHGEILNLTSLLYHPMIERLPFDTKLSSKLFFSLRSALGALTLFFPDKISAHNKQILYENNGRWKSVKLLYQEEKNKLDYMKMSTRVARNALFKLRCIPKGLVSSKLGSGIHYAGTIPMGSGYNRCNSNGQSNLFQNLYIADGAAFPSLPSKSISISLAAHATRVAQNARIEA